MSEFTYVQDELALFMEGDVLGGYTHACADIEFDGSGWEIRAVGVWTGCDWTGARTLQRYRYLNPANPAEAVLEKLILAALNRPAEQAKIEDEVAAWRERYGYHAPRTRRAALNVAGARL